MSLSIDSSIDFQLPQSYMHYTRWRLISNLQPLHLLRLKIIHATMHWCLMKTIQKTIYSIFKINLLLQTARAPSIATQSISYKKQKRNGASRTRFNPIASHYNTLSRYHRTWAEKSEKRILAAAYTSFQGCPVFFRLYNRSQLLSVAFFIFVILVRMRPVF